MNFALVYILSCIFLIPLIPAILLYKFLPAKTAVTGPFKGLNIKLSGAFSGYFLLVLIALGVATVTNRDKSQALLIENAELRRQVQESQNNHQFWTIQGKLEADPPELTKIFVYEKNLHVNPIGGFSVDRILLQKTAGKINLPEAICFYHPTRGYRVLNLNEKIPPNHIADYKVSIDTPTKRILIGKTITLEIPTKIIYKTSGY